MTHHARLNLIMLITIAGLLLFLYFKPQPESIQEFPIASNSIDSIQTIRIAKQQEEIVLQRQANHWYLVDPIHFRANERKVKEILKILLAKSNHRFPLQDLARFGLDRPNLHLYFDGDYFGFGGYAPITNQQYVLTSDYVYLVSPHYALSLPIKASSLISLQLLADDEIPVKFEFNHLVVEHSNGGWNGIIQNGDNPQDADAEHWVQFWQTATAREVTLVKEQALTDDFVEINNLTIRLRDGQVINLKIMQNENEIVFSRTDTGISYHFAIGTRERLLAPSESKSAQ
ncbi:MAG: DUF4340 domain-containing protein [Nitrosomonas sp. PRO4]|nr:DUF4340 domain-containing protein [Nitrosomonas sp. PRO4]